jgi:hypothetical protein
VANGKGELLPLDEMYEENIEIHVNFTRQHTVIYMGGYGKKTNFSLHICIPFGIQIDTWLTLGEQIVQYCLKIV